MRCWTAPSVTSMPARDELSSVLAAPGSTIRSQLHVSLAYRFAKRTLDVICAAVGLLLLSPLLVVLAVAVKCSSPGPVLFLQVRVGWRGRPFEILKFRSMRVGSSGPAVTAAGDARTTPVGRGLRRYKLDELPQLWNVLVGDMSLVGPRPEVPRFVGCFPADYAYILSVRPGLTDYAALQYRDEESLLATSRDPESTYVQSILPAKISLYYRYLYDMSLKTDLALVFRTIAAVFK